MTFSLLKTIRLLSSTLVPIVFVTVEVTACSTLNAQPKFHQSSSRMVVESSTTSAQLTPQNSCPINETTTQESQASQVICNYYDAINHQDYARAYAYWSNNGSASHQTFQQFKRGFANTASVEVEIGTLGSIEGAVGSLYIEIPVISRAKTVTGNTQQFRGNYVLRRVNDVPGSTLDSRMWHLYSAHITKVNSN